jgi:hypothetical protein
LLLEQRAGELEKELEGKLREPLPPDAVGDICRSMELEAWERSIEERIDRHRQEHPEGDGSAAVSWRLRTLLNVEPELLEPIPLVSRNPDWRAYVDRQFVMWRERRKGRDGEWSDLGLEDAATTSRHLGYLADYALLYGGLPAWLRDNLGALTSPREAAHARRLLAIRMAEVVCFGEQGRQAHREFVAVASGVGESVQARLGVYAEREQQDADRRKDRESPHYRGFIARFLNHLAKVRDSHATMRQPQPGDEDLKALINKLGIATR